MASVDSPPTTEDLTYAAALRDMTKAANRKLFIDNLTMKISERVGARASLGETETFDDHVEFVEGSLTLEAWHEVVGTVNQKQEFIEVTIEPTNRMMYDIRTTQSTFSGPLWQRRMALGWKASW